MTVTKSPETILQVVCAWCGIFMGERDGKGQSGVSHGICPKCAAKAARKPVTE